MKQIVAILLLCLTANAGPIGFMQPRLGGTNLAFWITFNSTNGAFFTDYSPANLTCSNVGGITLVPGVAGNAGSFPTNSYIQAANSQSLNVTTALTVSAWIKPSVFPSSGNYFSIISKRTAAEQFALEVAASGAIRCGIYTGSGNFELSTATSLISTNSFSHVVATWNGSTNYIYVNGVFAAALATTGTATTSTNDLFIGRNSGGAQSYVGAVDDVRFWRSYFPSNDVIQLYNGGRATQQ